MNQRGQFYLIAALLAVAVLLSMGTIFARARVPQQDFSVQALADEIRDETFELINHDAFQNNNSEETRSRIEGLVQNYSILNPIHEMVIIYGNSTKLATTSYSKGLARSINSGDVVSDAKTITLTFGSLKYNFQRTIVGTEFHILIKKEGENGKTIVTR